MRSRFAGAGRWAGLLLAFACSTARAQIPLQPFAADYARRVDSAADVRFLLAGPAGKDGFIRIKDGRLATPDGARFRCWGVNVTGWTLGSELLPPKADAKVFAESLARLGVNCARLHFLDRTTRRVTSKGDKRTDYDVPVTASPAGLIDDSRDDTRMFDPVQLDRLDYLVGELKRNGVYVDLNLNVGRTYKAGDGVPDFDRIGVGKGIAYFAPELIALQKDYARQLLTHYNPYTKSEYRHEPAVAIVEITNENSLLENWMRNWLRGELKPGAPPVQADITPHYRAQLTDLYNAWLAANRKPSELARLRTVAGVGADQAVPLLRRGDFAEAPKERFYAEVDFYTHVETAFFDDMDGFLKRDLGVKSLVVGTGDHIFQMAGQPVQRTNQRLDILDGHVYWQHPAIYGKRNTPMVNDPLHSMPVKLSRFAMVGKPFTASEVNEPFPNDYAAEMIPILAAYGALQDWDGIFFYSFEPKVTGEAHGEIGDHFDLARDPVKLAQLPAGAMIFLRGDVAAAKQVVERTYSREQVAESARLPRSEWPYWTPGFPLSIPLEHGSRVKCLDCAPTAPVTDTPGDPITSDTGELQWRTDHGKDGLFTIDSPRTSALVGFIKANPDVSVSHLAAELDNDFAALTLSSLDGRPLSRSDLMLVTATSRVENTGSVWNARRTMLQTWGDAPTVIEPVKGWITLRDLDGAVAVSVTPLDGQARPLGEIRARYLETGWEFPVGMPTTTSYLVRVTR